jgi:hypothetical protein
MAPITYTQEQEDLADMKRVSKRHGERPFQVLNSGN